jgi:asparagine synthase (glutamine-hydrolysing)
MILFTTDEVEALMGARPYFSFTARTPVSRATAVIAFFLMQRLAPTHHIGAAQGLEVHAPFADAEVVSAAAQIPLNLKQKPGNPLYILYEAAYGLLPSAILNNPLPSESIPLAAWLRDQQGTIREILLGKTALKRGLFRRPMIERLITQHVQETFDHSRELLALMSLEIWHQLFVDPTSLAAPIESF